MPGPRFAEGKICYLEIPCEDPEAASAFYAAVFGWELHTRGDGSIAFDDGVREVSGTWVTGRPPSAEPGIVAHVMVAEIDPVLARVRAAGGRVVRDVDAHAHEAHAHVADPYGNVVGVYQGREPAERPVDVSPIPAHLSTVTARIAVTDALSALEFYRHAFGAKEISERFCDEEGRLIHTELRIGDSVVMLTEDEGYAALLCTYWPDVDAAWERAVDAGATVVHPLADHFYGERGGRLEDPFGQQWMLSARTEIVTAAEAARRAAEL